MKNNKILTLIASLFMLGSCGEVLDVLPEGRMTLDEIFGSEVMTGAYLNGCYQNFPQYAINNYFWTNTPVALSDDAWEYATVASSPSFAYNGNVTSSIDNNLLIRDNGGVTQDFGALNSWDLYARNIRRCNIFISRIPTAVVPTESDRKRWLAEAKVLRAFYYLELLGRFGAVQMIKEPLPADYDNSKMRKNTFKECVDEIIKDCNEALAVTELPWRITVANEARRMTKAVACAIKSRAILYAASPLWNEGKNHWAEAERITKEALDDLLSNDYQLYTRVTNASLFGTNAFFEFNNIKVVYNATPADKETILESTAGMSNWYNVHGLPINVANKAGLCPTQELVDSYPLQNGKYILDLEKPYLDEKHLQPNFAQGTGYDDNNPYALARDPRFDAVVIYNGVKVNNPKDVKVAVETFNGGNSGLRMGDTKRTCTGYYSRKHYHPAQRQGKAQAVSWRIFRLAEMYLNYAEAANENGHKDEAVLAIEPIRNRVNMPNIAPKDQSEARLMIRQERRIEMAYEENRYYDMRRWTEPDKDMATGKYLTGMWIEKSGATFTYRRFVIGNVYNRDAGTWSGTEWKRACYTNKYLLHPIDVNEASRLETATGVRWQNPGW